MEFGAVSTAHREGFIMFMTEVLDCAVLDQTSVKSPVEPSTDPVTTRALPVGDSSAEGPQGKARPDVVVFVTRTIAAQLSDPELVAGLICSELDKRDPDSSAKFSVERAPTEPDSFYRIQRSTKNDKRPVLDLYTLCVLQNGDEVAQAPIRRVAGLAFNIIAGLILLIGAGTFRRGNRAKGLDQKLQLIFCLFVLSTLVVYLVVVIWALVDAVQMFVGNTPTINWPQWVVVIGAVLGLLFPGFRAWLTGLAAGYQKMMRYVWTSESRNEVTGQLRSLVDRINRRKDFDGIHLVGYSLGSLVLLDTVMSQSSTVPAPMQSIKTLTTIGCPFDLVRTLKPNYPDLRTLALPKNKALPTWTNVYAPIDALGSDFKDRPKREPLRFFTKKGRTAQSMAATASAPESAAPKGTAMELAAAKAQKARKGGSHSRRATLAPLQVNGWHYCHPKNNLEWNADLTLDPVNFLMLASISSHMTYWSTRKDSDTVWGIVVDQIASAGRPKAAELPSLSKG